MSEEDRYLEMSAIVSSVVLLSILMIASVNHIFRVLHTNKFDDHFISGSLSYRQNVSSCSSMTIDAKEIALNIKQRNYNLKIRFIQTGLKKFLSICGDPFGGNPFVADQYWTPAMKCQRIGVSRVVQIMPEECRRLLGKYGYIQEGEDSGAAGLHIGQVVNPRRDHLGSVSLPIRVRRVVMIVIITADIVFDNIIRFGITRVKASDGTDTSAYSLQHRVFSATQLILGFRYDPLKFSNIFGLHLNFPFLVHKRIVIASVNHIFASDEASNASNIRFIQTGFKKLLSISTDPFGGNPFVADQYWTPAMKCQRIGVSRVVQIMPEKCRKLLEQNGYIQEGEDSGAAGLHVGQVVNPSADPLGSVTLPIGVGRFVMIVIITADTVFDSIVCLGISGVEASDGTDTSAYSLQHRVIVIVQPIAVRHPYIESLFI
ncbi:unnamed protein product [Medioppia subpectinata]|uniref:Uncharacterized protein n=1 Tax=Medioppia subpectinata TaxID=1979941 RepID=A0A7R9PWW3_9ACAR|nr:unnamed protein product [Medioppia subpectinata]CAG2104183.1 unnamed protein product [Medioppia subpectinata]